MKINPTKFTLLVVCSLFTFTNLFAQKARIDAYIEQYKNLAMQEMVRTGVPASITLAQGLLETGFGESELATKANNHFGIKCKGDWTGERVYHDDDAKGECFRKYVTAEESYKDHSDFLRLRPNYAALFTLNITDYEGWAKGLKAAGYATNPQYPQRLIKIIEENNLHQYTLLALENQQNNNSEILVQTQPNTEVKITNAAPAADAEVETPVAAVAIKNETFQEEKSVASNYPTGVFTINDSKVLFVTEGTSLFALAANNNISYNKLLEFNDLGKVDIIEKSQLVFLQKKQKRGSKDFHIVEPNEDLHMISQKEGVQLNSILEFNNLQKGVAVNAGQRLYLKATSPVGVKAIGATAQRQTSPAMR